MNRRRLIWSVAATALGLSAVFVIRSEVFGTRASPGEFFPDGFAGTAVAVGDAPSQQVLPARPDGTPAFTADPIRFDDTTAGETIIERPAVTLAEADRLGHGDRLRTPEAVMTYAMRGPMSAGFTEADARWLIALHHRHDTPEMRRKALSCIALALLNNHQYDADSWQAGTPGELMAVYEAALLDADPDMQAAALRMSDWDGWAAKSPTFIETLRAVADAGGPNAQDARRILAHVFLLGEPE